MKGHVEIGHLTEYDAFRVNRGQDMNLEIWLKLENPYKRVLFCFIGFVATVKSPHAPTI